MKCGFIPSWSGSWALTRWKLAKVAISVISKSKRELSILSYFPNDINSAPNYEPWMKFISNGEKNHLDISRKTPYQVNPLKTWQHDESRHWNNFFKKNFNWRMSKDVFYWNMYLLFVSFLAKKNSIWL